MTLPERVSHVRTRWRNRQQYDEDHANPLRKQYHDKGKDNVVLDLTQDTE